MLIQTKLNNLASGPARDQVARALTPPVTRRIAETKFIHSQAKLDFDDAMTYSVKHGTARADQIISRHQETSVTHKEKGGGNT